MNDRRQPWYAGVSGYQWLVLAVASLGWAFDTFEGQIFVASMNEAMPDLLPPAAQALSAAEQQGRLAFYNNVTFACFLLGGALGGVLFGMLADRIGRVRTMVFTIGMYSAFTCVSALSQSWWQMAIFRFLVAMGVGGEWAVASALVAEMFSTRARAWSLSIFHATSVLGTYLAVAAGAFIVADRNIADSIPFLSSGVASWRIGFALGALPALLIVAIRLSLQTDSGAWLKARRESGAGSAGRLGRFSELFGDKLRAKTFVGVALAAVGLATFWGAHIYGKDTLRQAIETELVASSPTQAEADAVLQANFQTIKRWEMLGMFLVTTGGGLGLLSFGPISERIGRRNAFLFFHVAGLAAALLLFQGLFAVRPIMLFLPIFGFLTLGMHAGYAVYFPELFPTRLRSTGAGFCFNMGRILAAPILFFAGWMQSDLGLSLRDSASLLSLLFLLGVALYWPSPETRGADLPD